MRLSVRYVAVLVLCLIAVPVSAATEAEPAAAAPMSIDVSPAEDLVDGQAIQVTGEGFDPDAFVGLWRCVGEPSPQTCVAVYGGDGLTVHTDHDGSFHASWHAEPRYEIGDDFTGTRQLVDCRERDDCSIAAAVPFIGEFDVWEEVHYDPTGAIRPRPGVSVEPTAGLVDRQVVSYEADGIEITWPPPQAIMCELDALTIYGCDRSTGRVVDVQGGSASGTYLVESILHLVDGRTIDCRDPGTPCALRLGGSYEIDEYGQAVLGFDPTGALGEPAITVSPSTGLVDGQHVRVTGEGFHPGGVVGIAECPTGAIDSRMCGPVPHHQVVGDAEGRFSTDFGVVAFVHAHGQGLDCTVTAACVLMASEGILAPGDFATYPISFAAMTAAVEPAGQAGPATPVTDGAPQYTG